MDEKISKMQNWLETATRGIRFGPDRAAVREELEAHLEDKTADLARIFPDMAPEEAQERALAQMGDPEELGKELARVHKPWLGYLWRASKWAAWLLAAVFVVVCVVQNDHYQSAGHPLWGKFTTVYGPAQSQRVELGGYTFQIVGAAYLDYPEGSPYASRVQVAVRVSSPRFWERIGENALYAGLTMTGPDGWSWSMDAGKMKTIWELGRNQTLCGLERAEWGVFHDTYVAYGDWDWQEGDRVCLEFTFGKGSFTLETDEIERVVMG